MRIARAVPLAALALVLSACASASPKPSLECLVPDSGLGQRIAMGASGAAIEPVALSAVKAPALKDAYLVGMTFTAAGVEGDQRGVWAVGSLADEPGLIAAVDGFAQSFTTWPSQVAGQQFNVNEPGAKDALACLDAG